MHKASAPSPAGCICNLPFEPPRWVPRRLRWILAVLVWGNFPGPRALCLCRGQQRCDAHGQPGPGSVAAQEVG